MLILVAADLVVCSIKIPAEACRNYLVPTSVCNICGEQVAWICGQCGKIDEAIHSRDNQLISYKSEKIALGNKKILHSIIRNVGGADPNYLQSHDLDALKLGLPFDITDLESAEIHLNEYDRYRLF